MIDFNKLRTAGQIKGKVMDILKPDDLVTLAKMQEVPHYIVVNPLTKEETYCFLNEEVSEWFKSYVLKRGRASAPIIEFYKPDETATSIPPNETLPACLLGIKCLKKVPINVFRTPPGIYFLCNGPELVYIGKAVNVARRLMSHIGEKRFDRVYFISCHIEQMDSLEMALIRYYKPSLNKAMIQKQPNEKDHSILSGLGVKDLVVVP